MTEQIISLPKKISWHINRVQRKLSSAIFPLKQFVVVSSGRSGSSFLIDLLQSHPEVTTCWEYFTDKRLKEESLSGRNLLADFKKEMERERYEKVRGVKFLYYQLEPAYAEHFSLPELLPVQRYVLEDLKFKIIHLIRKNRLRTVVSMKKAASSQIYHALKSDVREKSQVHKVEIDPQELIRQIQALEDDEQITRKKFRHHQVHEVVYEDLVANSESELRAISEFLAIKYQPVHSRFLRLSSSQLAESIANYDAVKKALEDTRWSVFLDG